MPIRPRTPTRSARSGLLRHWTLWAWFVLALILCVVGVFLWRSGRWLVHEDKWAHVNWALVLAGESRDCERSEAAIRYYKEGRIDTVILSATRIFKDRYQSEFMVDYLVQQGVPRDHVFEFRQDAYSTQEEARLLIRQFRLQGLDTVLIITSSYHTARTRRIFRKLARGYPVVLVAAADYSLYDPNAWWSNRESRKIWFNEWIKTLFTAFELWRENEDVGKAEFQGLTPEPGGSRAGAPVPPEPVPHPAAPDSASKTVKEPQADSVKAAETGEGKPSADTAKARKDSVKALETKAKEEAKVAEAKAAEAKAAEAKALRDSAVAAEAARSAVEGKDGKAVKDTVAKKQLPRAPKKPAAPVAKPAPKHEEKKPEKAEKTDKAKKKS